MKTHTATMLVWHFHNTGHVMPDSVAEEVYDALRNPLDLEKLSTVCADGEDAVVRMKELTELDPDAVAVFHPVFDGYRVNIQ